MHASASRHRRLSLYLSASDSVVPAVLCSKRVKMVSGMAPLTDRWTRDSITITLLSTAEWSMIQAQRITMVHAVGSQVSRFLHMIATSMRSRMCLMAMCRRLFSILQAPIPSVLPMYIHRLDMKKALWERRERLTATPCSTCNTDGERTRQHGQTKDMPTSYLTISSLKAR